MKLKLLVLATIAVFAAAPILVHKFWVKKDDFPPKLKEAFQWVLDHFISTSLLLLIASGSLFMFAKDRNNWPKVLVGVVASVAIVLYQTDNLGIVPGTETLNQNATSIHNRAKSAMDTEPWVMYGVAILFLLASLYLIQQIYLRPEVLGKKFGGGPDDEEEDDSPIDIEDIDYDNEEELANEEDPANEEDSANEEDFDYNMEQKYGGRKGRAYGGGDENVDDYGMDVEEDQNSDREERDLLNTVSGANESFDRIRAMG